MFYTKYHALGNDYLVMDADTFTKPLTSFEIQRICHRNYGVGSDGILLLTTGSNEADFSLRILNPDGSEAEKSGNGLRIFSRYLWDHKRVKDLPFIIHTPGGLVEAQMLDNGKKVKVEMGTVSFHSEQIPVAGPPREVLNEEIVVNGKTLRFCAATIGNPHCVILHEADSDDEVKQLGSSIEMDPRFPNRTNVQFLKVLDSSNIQIEIWERGAGHTLASGSSSSAAAAVAYKLGLCGPHITVHMPGGQLQIDISTNFHVKMTGPVTRIVEGEIANEMFDEL